MCLHLEVKEEKKPKQINDCGQSGLEQGKEKKEETSNPKPNACFTCLVIFGENCKQ